jgi:hypothetical protein
VYNKSILIELPKLGEKSENTGQYGIGVGVGVLVGVGVGVFGTTVGVGVGIKSLSQTAVNENGG